MRFQAYDDEGRARHFAALAMRPEDERLHAVPESAGFDWAETNMFGFNIPEHQIDCMVWFIYRPKLGATYGGVILWQGCKTHYLESEVFDFRAGLPLPADNTHWECPNGIRIEMTEPLVAFNISYRQPDGDIRFDLELRASMPPAMRYNGNHITQAMRTHGILSMNGTQYTIDGYYSRDRSWNEHRDEAPKSVPPLSWIAGVFGDDFAFHLTAFESPLRRPEWAGRYAAPAVGENVLWGYVWDHGRLLGIDRADLYVHRPDHLTPVKATLCLDAHDGGRYHIDGRVIALNPAMGWPNIVTRYALTEWRCRGEMGWGDIQDVMFQDHLRYALQQAAHTRI